MCSLVWGWRVSQREPPGDRRRDVDAHTRRRDVVQAKERVLELGVPVAFKRTSVRQSSDGDSHTPWAASSAGRAPRSQRGGREFEPPAVHHYFLYPIRTVLPRIPSIEPGNVSRASTFIAIMRLCPYCSREVADAAVICQHCGRDWKSGVSHGAPVQSAQLPSTDTSPWFQPPKTVFSRSWRTWVRWVVVILVLIYMGTCAVALQRIH